MAEKPLVLLVLFEGLARSVIDSTILEHARYMSDRGLARFNIWSFCPDETSYQHSRSRLAEAAKTAASPVRVMRAVRPGLPLSVTTNAWRLRRALDRAGEYPDMIHARGDYAAAVAARAVERQTPVLWDCRADSVSEAAERMKEYRCLPELVRRIKTNREEKFRRTAAKTCAAAAFVSHKLQAMLAGSIGGKPSAVTPCAASEDLFFWDPALRDAVRQELGYNSRDKVYVFSGTLKAYQRFDWVVSSFLKLQAQDASSKLLVLTPDEHDAIRVLQRSGARAATVVNVEHGLVNRYLNAADAAFMPRDKKAMNAVASPTKFAEYCLVGLPVIMNDAVEDAFVAARLLGNLLPIEELERGTDLAYDRAVVASQAKALLGREAIEKKYHEMYLVALGVRLRDIKAEKRRC